MKTWFQILHGGEFCKKNTIFYEKISKEKRQKVKHISKKNKRKKKKKKKKKKKLLS